MKKIISTKFLGREKSSRLSVVTPDSYQSSFQKFKNNKSSKAASDMLRKTS